MTTTYAARSIELFLDGKGGDWEWDDFISVPIDDPELNRIRLICGKLPDTHPPVDKKGYCNEEGRQVLREIVKQLRARSEAPHASS